MGNDKDQALPKRFHNVETAVSQDAGAIVKSYNEHNKKQRLEETMTDNKNKESIKIGSIIHLENIGSDNAEWGFLNILTFISGMPLLKRYQDSRVRAFVTTHTKKNRKNRSGSWQIISAESKNPGDELESGDKIFLRNIHPGAGYLDTFEWVKNIEPFKKYPMNIGVFASNVAKRGGGESGTWIIYKYENGEKQKDGTITFKDTICLKNEYPGAGYLFAYGKDGKKVFNHEFSTNEKKLFENYTEAKKFVFTGHAAKHGTYEASFLWQITSDNRVESLYRVENQWGFDSKNKDNQPWHEVGIFKFDDNKKGRVVALESKLDEASKEHWGVVKFINGNVENSYKFKAAQIKELSLNHYDVKMKTIESFEKDGSENVKVGEDIGWIDANYKWEFGSRDLQRVIALYINKYPLSIDPQTGKSLAFDGKIKYEWEEYIRIRALEVQEDHERYAIEYDYFNPDLLRGRSQKMQGVIDTTHKLLSNVEMEFGAYFPSEEQEDSEEQKKNVDFVFQISQLGQLQLLNKLINGFYNYQLKYVMKQAFKNHRADETLAPHHLVRRCFQNLAIDHEIIQRATVQRRWTHGLEEASQAFISEQAMEVLIMDKLAIKSIMPFKHLLFESQGKSDNNKDLAIITYLSEKTHIRYLPYTDQLILIGVSYDRVPQVGILFDDKSLVGKPFYAFELMAIPHEIAHYVYKHGTVKVYENDHTTFPEISKRFDGANPYYKWCEEIFADLYGCIVAGPLTVLSMQALLVSIDRGRAWKDDKDHPTPVLRVFILNEMLRILKDVAAKKIESKDYKPEEEPVNRYDFGNIPDMLDGYWVDILEKWGYGDVVSLRLSDIFMNIKPERPRPARIYQHDQSALHLDQIINVDRIINAIRPIIIEFATHLLDDEILLYQSTNQQDNELQFKTPWVERSEEVEDLDDMLNRFNKEMRLITNRQFVKMTTQEPIIDDTINIERPLNKTLNDYLENWGEHGPGGGTGDYD